jgi:hypothetical protein
MATLLLCVQGFPFRAIFPANRSFFPDKFFPFVPRNRCSAMSFLFLGASWWIKLRKFPVIFPDSRESGFSAGESWQDPLQNDSLANA